MRKLRIAKPQAKTVTINQPINWRRKDKACGEEIIGFCDPANGSGKSYNPGLITFNIKI